MSLNIEASLLEGVGSVGLEDGSISLVAGSGDGSKDGELELAVSVEVALGPSDLVFFVENRGSDDRNGVLVGSVVTSHLHVELTDGSVEGHVSELFVHVVDAGS